MKVASFTLLLAPPLAAAFVPATTRTVEKSHRASYNRGVVVLDETSSPSPPGSVRQHRRRELFRQGSAAIVAAFVGSRPAHAMPEAKVYSSNARNIARLNDGDSSGGSVYDNDPTSPKARARRAMVGCKNSSARSLAGENAGRKNLNEKECNMMVMAGDADFMLGALTELDCPTCPYGIGSR